MVSHWRPDRRNRRAGTEDTGFKARNDFAIPNEFDFCRQDGEWRYYYNILKHPSMTRAIVHGREITILEELLQPGWTYGCTAFDAIYLFRLLPPEDIEGIKNLVFRQPTKKQNILNPVWGRCLYDADFGSVQGPSIMVEAFDPSRPLRWPKKLSLEDQQEIERFRLAGHTVTANRRNYTIAISTSSARCQILYFTLLHEVGHWVHWQQEVLTPAKRDSARNSTALGHAYFCKPFAERERFAHHYAAKMRTVLEWANAIPFDAVSQ